MTNALTWNATELPPEVRETAHAYGPEEATAGGDSLTENLTLSETERDAAIGRLYKALRAMAQRIDNAERSQGEAASAMSLAAEEINAAALDQAQAFQHLANRIDQMERHAEPRAIPDEVERIREALGPHLAAIERKLEHFGAWLRQAEELSQPDTRLEDLLRSFGTRIDATERKTSAMLEELKTSLGETARRLEAIEYAMPLGGTPPLALGPASAEPAPGSDLPPLLDADAAATAVPEVGEFSALAQQRADASENFLEQARRAAQAAGEPEVERGGGSMNALRRPWMSNPSRAADGQAKQPWRVSRLAAAGVIVLLAAAGVLIASSAGNRREAPLPGDRVALQKSQAGGSPGLGSASVAPDPATIPSADEAVAEPASGTLDALTAQATGGDTKAALALGTKYADGNGVDEDDAEAARWLAQAAVAGEAVAQYRFGTLYEKGLGVDRDPLQAMSWYGEAARHGNRKAMHNLALLYAEGSGAPKSYNDAARWFRAAAELGVTDSQFNLAVLYERGWGVPASLSQAYTWYAIAAGGGDAEAKARIEALASELPDADRQAAESAAKAFTPRPMDVAAN